MRKKFGIFESMQKSTNIKKLKNFKERKGYRYRIAFKADLPCQQSPHRVPVWRQADLGPHSQGRCHPALVAFLYPNFRRFAWGRQVAWTASQTQKHSWKRRGIKLVLQVQSEFFFRIYCLDKTKNLVWIKHFAANTNKWIISPENNPLLFLVLLKISIETELCALTRSQNFSTPAC